MVAPSVIGPLRLAHRSTLICTAALNECDEPPRALN
jgi:hypothetical protein